MITISGADVLRVKVALRNPFTIDSLPLLSRLHSAAFRNRRRMSKRFVGRPAKRLFRLLLALGATGTGQTTLALASGSRRIGFNARNTQFGALYLPQSLPVYEPESSALLDRLVGDEDTFIDIGANWGWYSLLIASRPGYRGRIDAFEPFPTTYADLVSVVAQAGLDGVIRCHDLALADHDGSASMGFSDGVQSGLARLGEDGGARVRLARLDSLGLPKPDVIKIDAEDHELEVLQGAIATIDAARPFIVFENWLHRGNPDLTLAPLELLESHGYRFFQAGWVSGHADCVLAALPKGVTKEGELAVVPFLVAQRFQLPDQLNVIGVPAERLAEFKTRLG
jgi:FkbM family methyltransferase